MPTPPLPLLHQLLESLRIPILPKTLSATSPSLLLLILETLLDQRLPLPYPIRRCSTLANEVAVVKCILGVLADDVLSLDLSVVDPVRLVQGAEEELAVVVMALVVVAKRRGISISIPSAEVEDQEADDKDGSRYLEDSASPPLLPGPILPDISLSPGMTSTPDVTIDNDVFGSVYVYPKTSASIVLRSSPTMLDPHDTSLDNADYGSLELDSHLDEYFEHRNTSRETARSSTNNDRKPERLGEGQQTVLQQIIEEFGLGPETGPSEFLDVARVLTGALSDNLR